MSYRLRQEQALDIDQLQAMLADTPAKAAQAILLAAGQGVVHAQLLLGQILLDGRGIAADPALARRWFGIAAQQNVPMAHNMLGRCLEHGWGGAQDMTAAALHYSRAAELGLDWGLYNFANLLATGRGVAQDHRQALACYHQAAAMGHAKSMNLVGRYLEQGIACQADPQQAMQCYRQSAEAGDFRGQFSYATVLFEAGDVPTARVWFERALAQGNLNFLRVATGELQRLAVVALADLAQAYEARLTQLERLEDAPAAVEPG